MLHIFKHWMKIIAQFSFETRRVKVSNKQSSENTIHSKAVGHIHNVRVLWYEKWKSCGNDFLLFSELVGLMIVVVFFVSCRWCGWASDRSKNGFKLSCGKEERGSLLQISSSDSVKCDRREKGKSPISCRWYLRNGKVYKVILQVDLRAFGLYSPIMHINAIHPSSPNSSQSEDDAATRIQAQWKGYRVRKQLRGSRKSKNGQMNGEKVSIEEKSATKIQASWKGFKIRKELQNCRVAATKIQAGWKGFKTRKELKGQIGKEEKGK